MHHSNLGPAAFSPTPLTCAKPSLIYIKMGIATTVPAKSQKQLASGGVNLRHIPRTMQEEYFRMFDRKLAAAYIQEKRAGIRKAAHGSDGNTGGGIQLPSLQHMLSSLPFGALPDSAVKTRTDQQYLMPRYAPLLLLTTLPNSNDRLFRLDLCECGFEHGGPSRITATFEVPGMCRADVALEVRGDYLVVEGLRRPPVHLRRAGSRAPSVVVSRRASPAGGSPRGLLLDAGASQRARSASPNESGAHAAPSVDGAESSQVEQQDADMNDAAPAHGHSHAISEIRYGQFRRAIKLPPGTDVRPPPLSRSFIHLLTFISPHRLATSRRKWRTECSLFHGHARAGRPRRPPRESTSASGVDSWHATPIAQLSEPKAGNATRVRVCSAPWLRGLRSRLKIKRLRGERRRCDSPWSFDAESSERGRMVEAMDSPRRFGFCVSMTKPRMLSLFWDFWPYDSSYIDYSAPFCCIPTSSIL